uniref:CRISPR-associated endoribonuclease n=1 Tax=Fervidicoccus fontis TaxID=683846 RepID=A0A7J3SKB8_9CREN
MRFVLKLRDFNGGVISLPQQYNHLVQAAIYNSISPALSNFLHEKGFLYGKRSFKLFTFSRLLGKYRRVGGRILFEDEVELLISSPIRRFVKDLANFMLKNAFLTIGGSKLSIVGAEFLKEPELSREVKIRTLSPVTVYSTLYTSDGKKKTYYYSPYERDFSRLVDGNAKKKLYILEKRNIKSCLETVPLKVREAVVMYKGTVVRGWHGIFLLKGPVTLIRCVYETGLGAKNSQGFGMFEVM